MFAARSAGWFVLTNQAAESSSLLLWASVYFRASESGGGHSDKAGRISFFCIPRADVSSHLKIAPCTTAVAGKVTTPSPAWGVWQLLLQENQSLGMAGPLAAPYDSSYQ